MKQIQALTAFAAASTSLLLTGCIDNGYDLSDIDTTSELKIENLTIPVNIDPIVLSDIITVGESDDDKLREVTINGKTFYAVQESDSIKSDPIKIDEFTATADPIKESIADLKLGGGPNAGKRKAPGQTFVYTLSRPVEKRINYLTGNIDPAIHSVTEFFSDPFRFAFIFKIPQNIVLEKGSLQNVKLKLLKGLSIRPASGHTYDASTGVLSVASLPFDASGRAVLELYNSGLNIAANGTDIDYQTHSFQLNSNFDVLEATLNLTPSASTTTAPQNLSINISYEADKIQVRSFTGVIDYQIDGSGLDIAPVELNDLPDFLAQERTNIILHNPQIYLNLTNPVASDKLSFQTGLKLTANRENEPSRDFTLDKFSVGYQNGTGPYNFCLSPLKPTDIPDGYSRGLEHVTFSSLSDVLSGNGLPKTIGIDLVKPQIPLQKVEKFALGRELPAVKGTYCLLAPLALTGNAEDGSVIYYTDKADGWNDEEIDNISISKLNIKTIVTSTIPLNAKLTAHPIDAEGKVINDVSVTGGDIPANATDQPIELNISGEVTHLDGIEFTAEVRPDGKAGTLAPSQNITLKNIKVNVSGKYLKKF